MLGTPHESNRVVSTQWITNTARTIAANTKYTIAAENCEVGSGSYLNCIPLGHTSEQGTEATNRDEPVSI
jgi:hypothetical protein